MKKIGKYTAFLGALLLICMTLFLAACDLGFGGGDDAVFSVSVSANDPALGEYTVVGGDSEGGYRSGSLVTVTVSPIEGYTAALRINGEDAVVSGNVCTFTITSDTVIEIVYSYRYRILTSVTGGRGKIEVSAPANGEKYERGEAVSVTVTPEAGYAVGGVTLNGAPIAPDAAGGFWFCIEDTAFITANFTAMHSVTVLNESGKGKVLLNGEEYGGPTYLSDGSEAEIEVVPTAGNRVKAVYANGGLVPLTDGKGTVKILEDTVIEVVYVEYYSVTIVPAAHCTAALDRPPEANGKYAAGTKLFFSVTAEEGYTILSILFNGTPAECVNGGYPLTVEEDVAIEVRTQPLPDERETFTVTVAESDPAMGTVTLGGTPEESGEYAYGTELTLTVRPAEGYDLDYITLNFAIVRPTEGNGVYTYAFSVSGDAEIFVAFKPRPRHTVTVERRGLAEKGVTVTLGAGVYGLLHDGADYADGYFYTGEEVKIAVSLGNGYGGADGTLFYSADRGERKMWLGEKIGFAMGEDDVVYTFFLASPTQPNVRFDLGTEGDPSEYYSYELRGDVYVFTLLKDPVRTDARFAGWTVEVDGEAVPAERTFTVPYSDDRGADVSITAEWIETVTFAAESGHGQVQVIEDGEPTAPASVYDKGSVLTLRITPEENYVAKELRRGSASGEILAKFTGRGPVEYTLTLSGDLTVVAVYARTYSVTIEGGEGKVRLLYRGGSAAAEGRFESGTELLLSAADGFAFRETPDAAGTELVPSSAEDSYFFTVGEEDIAIAVAMLPKLDGVNFPTDRAMSTGAPKQGVWKGAEEGADALTILPHSVLIGDDAVKEISCDGEGGATRYTVTTELGRTYSLSWFGEIRDYILELSDLTETDLRAAETEKRYYVDEELAESARAVWSEPLGGEWVSGGSVLTLGNEEGFLTLSFGGEEAKYLISVPSSACYLIVMEGGKTAYVMTVSGTEIALGGLSFTKGGPQIDPDPQEELPDWDGTGEHMREVTLTDGGTVTAEGTVGGQLSEPNEQSGIVVTVKGDAVLGGFLFRRDAFAYYANGDWSYYRAFDWYECPFPCAFSALSENVYEPAYYVSVGSRISVSVALNGVTLSVGYETYDAGGSPLYTYAAEITLEGTTALTVGFAQNGVCLTGVIVAP